jgi:5-methylthioadenosine/S-adenosylhomocysteine deaminase
VALTRREASDARPVCDLLLTGGVVVTVDGDRRVLDPGAVAVTRDRIVAVDTPVALAGFRAGRTVDCTGAAVMPGLIDCHTHLFQGLGRGLGEGMSLWPWLSEFMWPYSAAITSEEAVVAARLGSIEAARSGTTSVVDNHYSPADLDSTLAVADAIEGVGLRGVVARGIFGDMTEVARTHGLAATLFRYSLQEDLDITRDALEARRGRKVGIWPAPINVIYNDQELVRRAVAMAHEYGTGWHTHCSEARADPEIYLDAYGIRPVDWLDAEGLLGRGATIAHAIWLDDHEVERIGATGSAVSYNPTSNQYLASGYLRLRELRDSGAIVGIGTDGSGCGHRMDLFEEMRQSVYLQRVKTREPTASNGEEALELGTREGARFLGVDTGVLAPGKLADLAVVDLTGAHLAPIHRVVPALVYSASGADVRMTIVGGEVVFEDGRCTKVDEAEVLAEARARAGELVERARMQELTVAWRR